MREVVGFRAAAIVVAIVVTGCGGSASRTPGGATPRGATAMATSPTAPPAGTLAPGPTGPAPLPMDGTVPAGRYSLDSRLGVTIEVPAGWSTCCTSVILKDGFTGLLYADVTDIVVYGNPCNWSDGANSEPRGAAAIAAALAAQHDRDGSAPRDVTVGGLPALLVRVTVPADQAVTGSGDDIAFVGCDRNEFRSFDTAQNATRYHQGPGQIDEFYLVDVGSRTVVFDVVSSPEIEASDMAALGAMLESVEID
jgi:hypothetical protein